MERPLLTPPFFLFEDTSVDIFQSLETLENKIEPQDWKNGIYQIFDSSGKRLIFHIVSSPKKWLCSTAQVEHVRFLRIDDNITDGNITDEFDRHLRKSYQAYLHKKDNDLNRHDLMSQLMDVCGFSA